MTVFNIPREQRTPETEIDLILSNLSFLYNELHPGQGEYVFVNTYFKEFYENEHTSGDILARAHHEAMVKEHGNGMKGTGHFNPLAAMVISCAYLCQAQRAWDSGKINEAWTYIVDAHFWCGLVLQRCMRMGFVADMNHAKKISEIRRDSRKKGVEDYDYSDFILNEYKKRGYKTKTEAIDLISKALLQHIEDNNLPRKNFKVVTERGDILEEPQTNFTRMVQDNLSHISAAQVKADYLKFLKQE